MTRLLVNTRRRTVHTEDCPWLHQITPAGFRWFTEWVGAARSADDKACSTCLPDGLPTRG